MSKKKYESVERYIKRDTSTGRYLARVKDSKTGRWYPSEVFDRLSDAREYRDNLIGKRARGERAQASEIRALTFANYFQQWASECRGQVSEGWRQTQDQLARSYILPVLGRIKFVEVATVDIVRLLEGMRRTGRSPQQQRHVYNLLHKMFEDAIDLYEIVNRNPVRKKLAPRVPVAEREFLEPQESFRFLEFVKGHWMEVPVALSLFAGLRPSEVQGLEWGAVDFERNQIIIRQAYKRKVKKMEPFPKGKKIGRVPMAPPLRQILEQAARKKQSIFVACGIKGGMLDYDLFYKTLKRMTKDAGVTVISPHELRHSCTELWVNAGASREDIARILNQTSPSAIHRYMHRTDSRLNDLAAKVGFEQPTPPPQHEGGALLRLVH